MKINTICSEFTLIIPAYNAEKYIWETLMSVNKSTESIDIEVIVIDDGSSDKTAEIVRLNFPNFRLITQENRGEAEAVNVGLGAANSKYALVLSADDLLVSKEIFVLAKNILDKELETVVVYFDWWVINEQGEKIELVTKPDYSKDELIGRFNCLPGPGSIFRLDTALEVGGRDSSYKFVSDYDFWLRMSEKGSFVHVSEPLACWRQHSNSTSIKSKGPAMASERIEVIQSFLKNSSINEKLRRRAISSSYYNAAILGYFDSRVKSKQYMIKSLIVNRFYIPSAKLRIILFILLMPFSKWCLNIITRLNLVNLQSIKK